MAFIELAILWWVSPYTTQTFLSSGTFSWVCCRCGYEKRHHAGTAAFYCPVSVRLYPFRIVCLTSYCSLHTYFASYLWSSGRSVGKEPPTSTVHNQKPCTLLGLLEYSDRQPDAIADEFGGFWQFVSVLHVIFCLITFTLLTRFWTVFFGSRTPLLQLQFAKRVCWSLLPIHLFDVFLVSLIGFDYFVSPLSTKEREYSSHSRPTVLPIFILQCLFSVCLIVCDHSRLPLSVEVRRASRLDLCSAAWSVHCIPNFSAFVFRSTLVEWKSNIVQCAQKGGWKGTFCSQCTDRLQRAEQEVCAGPSQSQKALG